MKIAFALAAVLLACACATIKKDPTAPLQGAWTCQFATVNGNALSADIVNSLRLTLTGDRYKTERGAQTLFDSAYTVDISKNPHYINIRATEGPQAGQDGLGIYALDGNTLRLCYTTPGSPRPTTFASPANSNLTFILWKREGPAPK